MAELDRGDVRLRRIFEQIDLAATPASAALRRSLARWERFRAGQAAPTLGPPQLRDAAEPLPEELIGVTDHRGRNWRVRSVGATARRQLGLTGTAATLAEATERRLALQLRLLLNEAVRRGEPLVALCACRSRKGERLQLEILVAPLDSGSRLAPAALAAVAARAQGHDWRG